MGGEPVAAPAPDPYYADGALRALIVARNTVLHETPRIDARRLRRLDQGALVVGRYSIHNPEWKRFEFEQGEVVYVFGNPFFPAVDEAE